MVKALFMGWYTEWKMERMSRKREILCLVAAVVIRFTEDCKERKYFLPL